jgi:hypothetical protein
MKKLINSLVIVILFASCNNVETIEDEHLAKTYTINAKKQLKDSADVIFYVDLSRGTNEHRFFVLNLKDSAILNQGLCLNGKRDDEGNVIYSNVIGSKCSSKGVYRIGYQYVGRFGKAFKLQGLEKTNSNAEVRNVVLHSYKGIPRNPTAINILGRSEGCPTVNPEYLEELAVYITEKKVKYLIIN